MSLAGGFGEIRAGRDLTPAFNNLSEFNVFGSNGTGNVGGVFYPLFASQTHVRTSSGVSYLTLAMGGFYDISMPHRSTTNALAKLRCIGRNQTGHGRR